MAVPEERPMHGLLPCELFDGQHQGSILLVFPLELRPDAARRRLKDERSVPFGAGCPDEALTGFYGLAGDDEHRPADEVGANDRAGHPGPEAVERPGRDVRHRFRRSSFRHQLSLNKVEAGPGKLTALEQGQRPMITGKDGRRTIELITAIYKSGSLGQTVTLPIQEDDDFYTFQGLLSHAPHFYEKTASVENFAPDTITVGNYDEKK